MPAGTQEYYPCLSTAGDCVCMRACTHNKGGSYALTFFMSLDDPKIGLLRERWNALRQRQERAYVLRNGNWNGASRHGQPYRFLLFCQRIESAERARLRFAEHTRRVERAFFAERLFQEAVRLNRFYADLLQRTAS